MRSLLIAGLAMTAALVVQADPIDPVFSVEDPTGGTPITTTTFTFSDNQSGGGIFNFVNESLQNWTKLDFSVDLPSNSTFACGPGPFFSFCQIAPTLQAGGTTLYDISLTGPTPATGGLGNGVPFTINLNDFISPGTQNPDPNGSGGWLPDNTFNGRANDFSPEPSTWLLLVAGFGGIGCWGLLKRKRTV